MPFGCHHSHWNVACVRISRSDFASTLWNCTKVIFCGIRNPLPLPNARFRAFRLKEHIYSSILNLVEAVLGSWRSSLTGHPAKEFWAFLGSLKHTICLALDCWSFSTPKMHTKRYHLLFSSVSLPRLFNLKRDAKILFLVLTGLRFRF
jgi:hypothetical protein